MGLEAWVHLESGTAMAARRAAYACVAAALATAPPRAAAQQSDITVWGATPAGVMAAYTASRSSSYAVTIVDTYGHVGGLMTAGLGNTDVGDERAIGGYVRDFFLANARVYNASADAPLWQVEPHVAAQLFAQLLANVTVVVDTSGPTTYGNQGGIYSFFNTAGGGTFSSRYWIDATYEGDLLAAAGGPFRFGREGEDSFGEAVAGRRGDNWTYVLPINPYNASSGALLPLMSTAPFVEEGHADGHVQAYSYRLCVTNVSANRVPFPPPAAYNASEFELLRRWAAVVPDDLSSFFGYAMPIPWLHGTCEVRSASGCPGKFDLNSDFAVSMDVVGGGDVYATADLSTRRAIEAAHKEYTLGWLHTLAHDDAIPARVREEVRTWGLCQDEFAQTGHWPPQLYVREGRRLAGSNGVFSTSNIDAGVNTDPIALGSYSLDNHHAQRLPCIPTPEAVEAVRSGRPLPGVYPAPFSNPPHAVTCVVFQPNASFPGPATTVWVAQEGHMGANGAPGGIYQLPYNIICPSRMNIAVPVALSASHAAYASIRMEPTWMLLGQAAGVAAVQGIDESSPAQRVIPFEGLDKAAIGRTLRSQGAFLDLPPPTHG